MLILLFCLIGAFYNLTIAFFFKYLQVILHYNLLILNISFFFVMELLDVLDLNVKLLLSFFMLFLDLFLF